MQLDPKRRTVKLLTPGMQLDLGGIAKGYAADEGLKVLARHGVTSALVAASGDIAVSGPPPGKPGWRIDIAPLPGAKEKRQLILKAFRKAERTALVQKEERELAVISGYLPEQLDEAKVREIAARVIRETGAKGPQDTKVVMPRVIAETKGRADGKIVSGVVSALLREQAS